jgi:hypothetical protein
VHDFPVKNLYRDIAAQGFVQRAIDNSHPSAAKSLDDLVMGKPLTDHARYPRFQGYYA